MNEQIKKYNRNIRIMKEHNTLINNLHSECGELRARACSISHVRDQVEQLERIVAAAQAALENARAA